VLERLIRVTDVQEFDQREHSRWRVAPGAANYIFLRIAQIRGYSHSRGGGNPVRMIVPRDWIPACAGMTRQYLLC
jgi:hypothetical protein